MSQAYALLRVAPAIFITNLPVLCMCVISNLIEGLTIMWEITCYNAPAGAMLPQTLMGVFASVVTYVRATRPAPPTCAISRVRS